MSLIRVTSARQLAIVVCVLGTIGCDHLTKHAATITLAGFPTRSYLADTIRLGYAENAGGFLSMGASLPLVPRSAVFTVIPALLLIAITAVAIRRRWGGTLALGAALFVAGAASNWIDRLARGTVVDFLNVGIGPVRTGIFNVADVAIMVGALMFVYEEFRPSATSEGPPTLE
jgi:signal peptidase II